MASGLVPKMVITFVLFIALGFPSLFRIQQLTLFRTADRPHRRAPALCIRGRSNGRR